jgi:hypothetical protein
VNNRLSLRGSPRPLPLAPPERAPVPVLAIRVSRAVPGPVGTGPECAASILAAVGVDDALPLGRATPVEVASLRRGAVAVGDAVTLAIEAVTHEAAPPRSTLGVSRARGGLIPAHPDEASRLAAAVGVDGALALAHRTETVVAPRVGSAARVGSACHPSVHAQSEAATLPTTAVAVRRARVANPACIGDPAGGDRRQRRVVGGLGVLGTAGLCRCRRITFEGESGRPLPVVTAQPTRGGAGADDVGLPRLEVRCRRVTRCGQPPGEQRHREHHRDQDPPSPPHLRRVSPRFRSCGPSRLP